MKDCSWLKARVHVVNALASLLLGFAIGDRGSMCSAQEPAPPPPPPSPGVAGQVQVTTPQPSPAPEVNQAYFQAQLTPYGTWMEVGGVLCWRPDTALRANPDWRPYYDMGRWVYTENGWFWQSDYGWGDIPFHYGRWFRDPVHGWLWAPDYTWGPAWVCWRHAETDGSIGWGPLPPGTMFVDGGWMYHGSRVAVGFDFGLGEGVFVFVGYDHFHDGFFRMRGREYAFHVRPDRVHLFYGRSVLRNEFRMDGHGRFVNEGLGRERIERLTNHRVEVARFEERHPAVRAEARPAGGAGQAKSTTASRAQAPVNKVYRPPVEASKAATGARPATPQKR